MSTETPRIDRIAFMARFKRDTLGPFEAVHADSARQLERELTALLAEQDRLREALRPFATYAKKRAAKPFAGLDDMIHTIHAGTEWEAELRLSHCEAARRALGEE